MMLQKLDDILYAEKNIGKEHEGLFTHIRATPIKCCESPSIFHEDVYRVCRNCARIFMHPEEDICFSNQLNPKYQLTTAIAYSNKNMRDVYRIHKWLSYDYRENKANEQYYFIREIGEKFDMNERMLDNACYIYKSIYIDENVSSRDRVKYALYIYCIKKTFDRFNKSFDIIRALEDTTLPKKDKLGHITYVSLTIKNYNDAISKVKDDDKLYLNENIPSMFRLMKKNFSTNINMNDIIKEYNKNYKTCKEKGIRLNNNSLLVGSIYILLNLNDDKEFFNTFNITGTTIKKFNKIL